VFTKNGISTLANVVIVDPTQANLLIDDPMQPKDLLPPKQFKPKKRVITIDTPLIISSL
jgi:hypothetical protein